VVIQREEDLLADFFSGGILNDFACSSTTKGQRTKQRLPLDSACLKGTEILFHGILILVGSDTGDEEIGWAEF